MSVLGVQQASIPPALIGSRLVQQNKQSRIDSDSLSLAATRISVFIAALIRTKLLLKQIEGHAEPAGGEQLVAIL